MPLLPFWLLQKLTLPWWEPGCCQTEKSSAHGAYCLPNTFSNFSNSTGQKICKCISPMFLTYPWDVICAMKVLQAPCSLTVCSWCLLSWTHLDPLHFLWSGSVASRERTIFCSIQKFLLTQPAAVRARLWGNKMNVT